MTDGTASRPRRLQLALCARRRRRAGYRDSREHPTAVRYERRRTEALDDSRACSVPDHPVMHRCASTTESLAAAGSADGPLIMFCVLMAALLVLLAVHPYTTYPLSLALLVRLGGRQPIRFGTIEPPVSFDVVFCAYNEAKSLGAKLKNCDLILDRYADLRVHVFNDGSQDATGAILKRHVEVSRHGARFRVVNGPTRRGKSAGMNQLLAECRGQITVFTDANVHIDPEGLEQLAKYFSDPKVGCVCGHLIYVNSDESPTASVSATYWRLEEWLKELETLTGSVMGADGSIFAVRRSGFRRIPNDIIDDYFTSFSILCSGMRIVRAPELVSYERSDAKSDEEFRRKVRIACRSFNAHRLLWPRLRHLGFLDLYKYISHKLLRWLSVLWLFLATIAALAAAAHFHLLLPALVLGGLVGLVVLVGGGWLRIRLFRKLMAIIMAQIATGYGVWRSLRGDRFQTWEVARSAQ
jgi:cellulose synthase/poly-beta-1,6-N-acetylglucosamine synthase-like glycosyltransferase